jgi:cyclic pyranopterin phosphate synthase
MPVESSSPLLRDTLGRPLRSLRLSVTDRCNLRCLYCMPEEEYVWLPREALLTFEELTRLVELFTSLGISEVRLTGGEPLLRHDLHRLVGLLAANNAIRDLALTTNGILLADQAESLRRAGLSRVTVSLDTLRPDRFQAMTRRDDHARVLAGLTAAQAAGFNGTKLDAVILRGVNDDELVALIEFGRSTGAEVRFIEYMDVAGATKWNPATVVSREEMLRTLSARYGTITPVAAAVGSEQSSAPAERFTLPDGTVFGIIASTTAPFCRRCDRSRLTADGMWYRCLYATAGTDLRAPLRQGASPEQISALIAGHWRARDDRGAELRKAEHLRGAFIGLDELRRDPHLEMHTRGG